MKFSNSIVQHQLKLMCNLSTYFEEKYNYRIKIQQMCNFSTDFDKGNGTMEPGSHKRRK